MLKKLLMLVCLIGLIAVGVYFLNRYFAWFGKPVLPSGKLVTKVVRKADFLDDTVDWQVEPFVEDLEVPWSLVFTSNERMLVTERPGRIRQVVGGKLMDKPVMTIDEVSSKVEEGLMGLALDPDYVDNQAFYVCYAYAKQDKLWNKVVRLIDETETARIDRVILDEIPSASFHAGCRLGFGPDNKLYVTTGDASEKQLAQRKDSLAGKFLRLNPDGSTPGDNPFGNLVWSFGHRNPQGFAWHPESNLLYATEHGPSLIDGPAGGDEINLIEMSGNYGWPLVSHEEKLAGTFAPLITFTPAEAPASAMFYSGAVFAQYRHDFFFGALRGEGIMRVRFDTQEPHKIDEYEKLDISVGRVREVVEGPDGLIYFTSSNRDGRGEVQAGDDKIYRLVPIIE